MGYLLYRVIVLDILYRYILWSGSYLQWHYILYDRKIWIDKAKATKGATKFEEIHLE